jgi:hypothetical protein
MVTKESDALARYKSLRADAAFLRKYADENASAGPTFWGDLRKCIGAAIADCTSEAPEGVIMCRLSKEQMFAVGYVADLVPLMLRAAERLDRDAEKMTEGLKAHAAETAALAAELEASK